MSCDVFDEFDDQLCNDLCNETQNSIKVLTNGSQLTTNSSFINFPLITSDSSKLNAICGTNILIASSDSVTLPVNCTAVSLSSLSTTIVQIDASNSTSLSLLQNCPNVSPSVQTLIASNLLDVSNDLTHYVIQTDSSHQFDNSYANDLIDTISNSNNTSNGSNSGYSSNNCIINNLRNDNIINNKKMCNKRAKTKKEKNHRKTTQITRVLTDEEVVNDFEDSDYVRTDTNRFKCSICSLELSKLFEMRRHFRSHSEDKPFKCLECNQCFNIEVNLRLHTTAQHYNQSIASKPRCSECNKSFTRLASLKSHQIIHEKDEMLSCGQCSQQFVSHFYLRKHLNSSHINKRMNTSSKVKLGRDRDELHCSVCFQKFNNSSHLKEHQKLHSQINSSLKHRTYNKAIDRTGFNHKCNTCGKTFKKNSQLIRHIRIHTGEKPFVCELCNKAFNQKNSLEIHRTKHTGERKFKCKFCSALFNQSGNMRSHIKRLHAPQADTPPNQLHECPFCNCVFKKVGILNCHISRRHSTEANNSVIGAQNSENSSSKFVTPCNTLSNVNKIRSNDLINKSLDKKSQMNDNFGDLLSKVLENSGVKGIDENGDKQIAQLFDPATGTRQTHIVRRVGKISYRQCLYCQKEFKKSSDLVRHVRIHTNTKPFKCTQCYRTFTVKGTLSAHMRTHDGIKPYVCQICNKSFSTSQSLKVHTRLHTGAQPYACSQCDKMFRTLGHLRSHTATHQRQSQLIQRTSISRFNKSNNLKDIDECLLSKIRLEGPILVVNTTDHQNHAIDAITDSLLQTNQMNKNPDSKSEVDHLGRPKRKYNCSHCEKAFKKSSHLTQHIRSHTGEKPFQCNVCLQSFVAKGSLKIHLQLHLGIKPFKCSECSFAFSTRGSLTRHMARHRDVRPYMCPYCQKTFKSSLNCKKHIKLHRMEFALQLIKDEHNPNNTQQTQQLQQLILPQPQQLMQSQPQELIQTQSQQLMQSQQCLLMPPQSQQLLQPQQNLLQQLVPQTTQLIQQIPQQTPLNPNLNLFLSSF